MNACIKDWEGAESIERMTDEQLRERERDRAYERKQWYREQQKSFDLDDELPQGDEPEYDPG